MDSETVHEMVRSGAGSSLPGKEPNTATGAAGEGCNEKAAFITPEVRRLKGVYEICFFYIWSGSVTGQF